ncbi:glycosyltransferase family 2 protein [Agrococcus sp. Marseille-P2731]|uniref:glycosyltransferase family 2 protein n=1 Tax=Agrococcus sp. Marseille-P2731 TaxID=1841862 RepID=UPI001F3382C7|nr:glycosyltransferase family 2 protein [Agrococcus sp. Marseille-P2731]
MTDAGAHQGVRVSVVIPVLDDATALRRCLERLAAQRVPPHEVIVVDNGCTDDSAAVARAAGARVVAEPTRGIPAAAARGYDEATGEVIARCDADSVVPEDWVERISDAFAADPLLEGLTGPGRFHDVSPRWTTVASVSYALGTFVAARAAIANVPLWGSNMALRRSSWMRVAALVERADPAVHDDLDLTMRLGPRARLRFDASLTVGAEGRIFRSPSAARDRIRIAMRTFRRNWAVGGSPGRRWVLRVGGPDLIGSRRRVRP